MTRTTESVLFLFSCLRKLSKLSSNIYYVHVETETALQITIEEMYGLITMPIGMMLFYMLSISYNLRFRW